MRILIIGANEAGRRLDRYLMKVFPAAPKSFLYKALRTNKIKVNGKKPADLSVILREKDELKIFITEEQWAEFGSSQVEEVLPPRDITILYEDDNLLILNKPVGLLSQKDHTGQPSLNEYGLAILRSGDRGLSPGFTPGVCNRLDRNTAGAVMMAKNLQSARAIQQIIEDKSLGKFYTAVVEGRTGWSEKKLRGYWSKDERTNQVQVFSEKKPGSVPVECRVETVRATEEYSILRVQLLTGKSHQIRAQLAAEGHPILGDSKYGRGEHSYQMLCARELVFPACPEPLGYMEGKHIVAPYPKHMERYV